ncbi:sigma-70 family RNA polymerase sigma factor [bacterium]|nr:sigma-70 family RNA polymerase sigma factor [bacterium]
MFFKKANIRPSDANEAELIEGCLKEDRRFQKELYDRYASKLMAVCYRYCKNREEAQDVLHEGFIKAVKNLHRFEGKGSFEGWLRRIMVNTALENFRKNKHLVVVEDIEHAESQRVESKALDKMSAEELLRLVNALPAGFRVVFNLYAIEGYSHKEIAEQLQISIGTSKSQLSRARAALQNMIKGIDIEVYNEYAQR